MRIEKRISFSLDKVWTEWCIRRHARKRISVALRVVDFPRLQRWNALVSECSKRRVNTILLSFGWPTPEHQAGDQAGNSTAPVAAAVSAAKEPVLSAELCPLQRSSQATRLPRSGTCMRLGQCGRSSGSPLTSYGSPITGNFALRRLLRSWRRCGTRPWARP